VIDKELLKWAKRGIIPLAHEDEEAFLQRASRFPNFKPAEEHAEAGAITKPLFGFSVDWIPIVYSNKKLPFWEAAATWIDPDQFPYVQLKTGFQKGSFFGIRRSEVLSHEAVHAARMGYNEPVFEEIFAYRTSPKWWRRLLGPLFRNPSESILFLCAALAGAVCGALGFFYALALPALLLAYYGVRLAYAHWILGRALKRYPLSFLIWLTDREIKQAARKQPLELPDSPRGRVLKNVLRPPAILP